MIQKVVKKRHLKNQDSVREDLAYWLSKRPEERIAAVEHLRRQYFGDSARLQRVARVIQRPKSQICNLAEEIVGADPNNRE
ncbi:MAG: hypothetical protein PHX83_03645 [Acidobacteriia bacterium]|nr:hypothetical protein [Terriglobia bacterium]